MWQILKKAQMEFAAADKKIKNLYDKLLSYAQRDLSIIEGGKGTARLKAIIEEMMSTIAPLKNKFTFKGNMRDTLGATAEKLANQMQVLSAVLPEYGGDPGGYDKSQVQKARNFFEDILITTAETLALKRAFDDGQQVYERIKSDDANNIFKQDQSGLVTLGD